jgi:hypothetical protein
MIAAVQIKYYRTCRVCPAPRIFRRACVTIPKHAFPGSGIAPIQRSVIKRLMESEPATQRGTPRPRYNRIRITAMNGKNSKFASVALSALLYTQGLLIVAGVAVALVKGGAHADPAHRPVLVASVASPDAEVR